MSKRVHELATPDTPVVCSACALCFLVSANTPSLDLSLELELLLQLALELASTWSYVEATRSAVENDVMIANWTARTQFTDKLTRWLHLMRIDLAKWVYNSTRWLVGLGGLGRPDWVGMGWVRRLRARSTINKRSSDRTLCTTLWLTHSLTH